MLNMIYENGKMERFLIVKKEYEELKEQIDSACKTFCDRSLAKKYEGWSFNQRKSLIIINYSFVKHGETKHEFEYVSFGEIEKIINENEPKIKQLSND